MLLTEYDEEKIRRLLQKEYEAEAREKIAEAQEKMEEAEKEKAEAQERAIKAEKENEEKDELIRSLKEELMRLQK